MSCVLHAVQECVYRVSVTVCSVCSDEDYNIAVKRQLSFEKCCCWNLASMPYSQQRTAFHEIFLMHIIYTGCVCRGSWQECTVYIPPEDPVHMIMKYGIYNITLWGDTSNILSCT